MQPTEDVNDPEWLRVCGLVTSRDVSKAFGTPMGNPHFTDAGPPFGQKICSWGTIQQPEESFVISLQRTSDLHPNLRKAGQTTAKMYTQTKRLAQQSQGSLQLAPGIGDGAFVFKSGITALKGDVLITASSSFAESPEVQQSLIDITKLAVSDIVR